MGCPGGKQLKTLYKREEGIEVPFGRMTVSATVVSMCLCGVVSLQKPLTPHRRYLGSGFGGFGVRINWVLLGSYFAVLGNQRMKPLRGSG